MPNSLTSRGCLPPTWHPGAVVYRKTNCYPTQVAQSRWELCCFFFLSSYMSCSGGTHLRRAAGKSCKAHYSLPQTLWPITQLFDVRLCGGPEIDWSSTDNAFYHELSLFAKKTLNATGVCCEDAWQDPVFTERSFWVTVSTPPWDSWIFGFICLHKDGVLFLPDSIFCLPQSYNNPIQGPLRSVELLSSPSRRISYHFISYFLGLMEQGLTVKVWSRGSEDILQFTIDYYRDGEYPPVIRPF